MKHVNPLQVISWYKDKGINCYAYYLVKTYSGYSYFPLKGNYRKDMEMHYFSEPLLSFNMENAQAKRFKLTEPKELLDIINGS